MQAYHAQSVRTSRLIYHLRSTLIARRWDRYHLDGLLPISTTLGLTTFIRTNCRPFRIHCFNSELLMTVRLQFQRLEGVSDAGRMGWPHTED